jgi:hypothetical protein
MKNLFEISSEEKNRILGLHESATKNQYLISEQNKLRGPGVKDVTDTTTTSYSKDISDFFPSGQYESEKVKNLISSAKPKIEEFIKKNGGKKFIVNIDAGESQVTNPKGFETKGSLALARANSVKQYFEEIFPDLIKNGTFVFKIPTDVSQVKIGETPYKRGDDKNDERYRAEQFVKFIIRGLGKITKTNQICNWDFKKIKGQGDSNNDYKTTEELVSGKGNLSLGSGRIPDRMVVVDNKGIITQDTGYVATGAETRPYSEFKLVPLYIANLTKLNGSKSVSGNNLIKIKANNYADLLTKILVNPKSTTYKDQATINFTEVGDGLSALKDLCNNGVKEFIGYTIVNQDTFTIPFDTSKGDTKVIVYSPIGKTSYSIKGSC